MVGRVTLNLVAGLPVLVLQKEVEVDIGLILDVQVVIVHKVRHAVGVDALPPPCIGLDCVGAFSEQRREIDVLTCTCCHGQNHGKQTE